MQLQSLEDLLVTDLQDLRAVEQQLVQALGRLADAASNDELKTAFMQHRGETEEHLRRVEEVLGELPAGARMPGRAGIDELIAKAEEICDASGDPNVKDAALIGAAQKVEHYEIAAYGTARTIASELGRDNAADLLDQNLEDEKDADKLLNKIATGGLLRAGINERAPR